MATRGWVVTELSRRLATQLSDAVIAATDTAGNLKEPVDDALRMLGYAEAELALAVPDDTEAAGFLALARLTTLKAVRDRLADRFDINVTGAIGLRLQQVVATVERMITEAQADVIAHYGAIPAAGTDTMIEIDMGYSTDPSTVVSRDWPWTIVGVGDG